ncbi:MAG: bifunctional class I SAM-dependent methyltransferase/glycosyltransferase family 2 protein [Acidobacteriota bacterium]
MLAVRLAELERCRENYWLRYPKTSPIRLRWRALAVRHSFHVLPGESILEIGAGSGLWTGHVTRVLRGENPITMAVFNDALASRAAAKQIPNTRVVRVDDLEADLPAGSFDYVIGTAILCHDRYAENLRAIHRLLKPGGQIFFFEANFWNPQVFVKSILPPVRRWAGDASCQSGMRRFKLMHAASQQGFTEIQVIPYDIVHPLTPAPVIETLQSVAFLLEHAPAVQSVCGSLYIWAKKPGDEQARRPAVNFATNPELFDSTSVVVPCRNEEMNVARLARALLAMYGGYIREILIVDDNSTDGTARVTRELARTEPRVKLLERRPPGGVGRALAEGYAAATGRYILTMDSDFALIVPELRDMFQAIGEGADGAIGSRFSHESVLINYPFTKILCNRAFHLIMNLLLGTGMRDVSNNLKLYRAEILKNLRIEEDHFAANVETGLKPVLAGWDIREVPISWINRTVDMGKSSFEIAGVAPDYAAALARIVRQAWKAKRANALAAGGAEARPHA